MDFVINYTAIIVAALVAMVLGAIWYSPKVFGGTWMALAGHTPESMKRMPLSPAQAYGLFFIVAIIKASVLLWLVTLLGALGAFGSGATVGFLLWLGFLFTSDIGAVLWDGKSWRLFFINTGYNLVALILMGGLVAIL